MRTYLRLKYQLPTKLPPAFREEELRYPEELVSTFVQRFTKPGEHVLDPFAGYGTTLFVAERMAREAYGVEIDPRRVKYVRSLLQHPDRLIQGDSRQLLNFGLPHANLVMSAPPFMAFHERENVLRGTHSETAYADYLRDLTEIYGHVAQALEPGGHVVIEVSNLKDEVGVTPLAWDVARAVGQVLHFENEIVITWDRNKYGYDHSYCLLFRAREESTSP